MSPATAAANDPASLSGRPWEIAPQAPPSLAAGLPLLHPVAVQVLFSRGLVSPLAIQEFLHSGTLHDPFALLGMDRAIARLRQAISRREIVAVHGDFDVDGVTATVVLSEGLRSAGIRVISYVPGRSATGYGLTAATVDQFAAAGVSLIVTCDTGSRAVEAVAHARSLGIDVIITDHHLTGPSLPDAVALVNPHQPGCPYPCKDLSGCGVSWKLVQALGYSGLLSGLVPDDLLDLVALGTIVDVSPLSGENRRLVQRGLRRLNEAPRPGIRALLARGGGAIDERTVAFSIGPRLNAAGRMSCADLALELLATRDAHRAAELVRQLDQMNAERQALTEQVLLAAREQAILAGDQPILVVRGQAWPGGVLGLVAARLTDEFRRPAIIVDVGSDACRGSARGLPGFDLVSLLDGCADLLIEHGGHAQAAGFAVLPCHLDRLVDRLLSACAGTPDESAAPIVADGLLSEGDLSWAVFNGLSCLRPFGHSNPHPLFLAERLRLLEARPVGAGGKHLRARLRAGRLTFTAFGPNFGSHAGFLAGTPHLDVLFSLESSTWNGNESLELRLQDARPSSAAVAGVVRNAYGR